MKTRMFMLLVFLAILFALPIYAVTAAKPNVTYTPSWRDPIEVKEVSPNGKYIAIFDKKSVYLCDGKGRLLKKLAMKVNPSAPGGPPARGGVGVTFAFNRQSTRLAVQTGYGYGEPLVHSHNELWCVELRDRKQRLIGEWDDCHLGPGEVVKSRNLRGWSRDGKVILVAVETGVLRDSIPQQGDKYHTTIHKYDVIRQRKPIRQVDGSVPDAVPDQQFG